MVCVYVQLFLKFTAQQFNTCSTSKQRLGKRVTSLLYPNNIKCTYNR